MKRSIIFFLILSLAIIPLVACGGGGGGSSSGGNAGPGMTPTKATSITGTVSASDGGSPENIDVAVYDGIGGGLLLSGRTNAAGAFSGNMNVRIDCSQIRIVLSKTGYTTTTFPPGGGGLTITPGIPITIAGLIIQK